MHISATNVSGIVKDLANITIAIKYEVTCGFLINSIVDLKFESQFSKFRFVSKCFIMVKHRIVILLARICR